MSEWNQFVADNAGQGKSIAQLAAEYHDLKGDVPRRRSPTRRASPSRKASPGRRSPARRASPRRTDVDWEAGKFDDEKLENAIRRASMGRHSPMRDADALVGRRSPRSLERQPTIAELEDKLAKRRPSVTELDEIPVAPHSPRRLSMDEAVGPARPPRSLTRQPTIKEIEEALSASPTADRTVAAKRLSRSPSMAEIHEAMSAPSDVARGRTSPIRLDRTFQLDKPTDQLVASDCTIL